MNHGNEASEPVPTEVTERELSRDEGKAAVAAARDALKQAIAASKEEK